MAFTTTKNNSDRTKVAVVVTVLEAVAVYAVIAGLTTVITGPRPHTTEATNIPLPPVPTSTPTPTASNSATLPSPLPTLTLPADPVQPTPTPAASMSSGTGSEAGNGSGTTIQPTASPTAPPLYKPRAPVPRGRTGDWVTTGDYPSQDLREGNQGVVRVRLEVTAAGQASKCTVTGSSGFPRLDAATCAKLLARSRFDKERVRRKRSACIQALGLQLCNRWNDGVNFFASAGTAVTAMRIKRRHSNHRFSNTVSHEGFVDKACSRIDAIYRDELCRILERNV